MDDAERWAARLASGTRVAERVAVVVAHADDETLFAGPLLGRLDDGLLIHVTDSAPHDMADAHRFGFATRAAYAAARGGELDRAVAALGADVARRGYGVPDQDAAARIGEVAARLADDLAGAAVVVTHAYEGGHPDHDAVACAVARAVAAMPSPSALVEFPSYHLADDARVWARFWHDPAAPEHARAFDAADIARVDAAIAAHASQAAVFDGWRPRVERYRAAPRHDFGRAPPPGECLYDRFGWEMTSPRWRALAAEQPILR